MLDTNIFDRLDADPEAVSELANRRDLRLFVSTVQLQELKAIPDPEKRGRLVDLAGKLCVRVASDAIAAGSGASMTSGAGTNQESARHAADRAIAEAAGHRCDLLVSEDQGLLEQAGIDKIRVMNWRTFVTRIVFKPR
jgi:predicted nucleic acid-binding protein